MPTNYFRLITWCVVAPMTLVANIPNYEDILELEQVAFLNCMFTDLQGRSKEIIIPRKSIDNAIKYGLPIDGSFLHDVNLLCEPNLLLTLHTDTLSLVPWTDTDMKTARIISTLSHTTERAYEGDVRSFLAQTLHKVQDSGYDLLVSPQLDFFICNNLGVDAVSPTPTDANTTYDAEYNPYTTSLKRTLLNLLLAQNSGVEKLYHGEAPGQYTLGMKHDTALTIADHVMITKQTIRALANAHSLTATFMPKPFEAHSGSSMHIACTLWDRHTNQNAFYDEQDPDHLSPIAKQFIAGILAHSAELHIIFNPTVNSYKRPLPALRYGKNNNSFIRVPRITHSEEARIEICGLDPLCCPYLVFAIIVKLGLEGIKEQMPLPVAENNVPAPASFECALTLFKESSYAKKIMGDTLYESFLTHKKEELNHYNSSVTNWELHTYFES